MEINLSQKIPKKFSCKLCDYYTSSKKDIHKHFLTLKHQKHAFGNNGNNLEMEKSPLHVCDCNKHFMTYSGLWKHKQKSNCHNLNDYNTVNSNTEVEILTNMVLEVVKQNQELINKNNEAQKQNQELQKQFIELCKIGTNHTLINNNSNNKTFNLNVFLNEQCKDAMNIMDFVDSLKLQLSDLESVGKLGFVEGISNIIIKNLRALDIHKRPVHCSDSKRDVMYVKDENQWFNDSKNEDTKYDNKESTEKYIKLRKAIKHIAHKNSKLIPEFREKYPDCGKSESKKSDQYNKLVIEAMGGSGDNDDEKEDKIIRKIAKEVVIFKATDLC
jgi:hypothetical protein